MTGCRKGKGEIGMDAVYGKKDFEKFSKGKSINTMSAILAKCYDCMGFYVDGTADCKCPECPLYPWMPYKEKK